MIIDVEIENWQLDCCGDPFDVGSTQTWTIQGAKPSLAVDGVPRYFEDHHGGPGDEVPQLDVTGRVLEIFAQSSRVISVPGARFTTNDPSNVLEEPVDGAIRFRKPPDGYTHMGFRVRFEIAEDTVLPNYVESRRTAEYEEWERLHLQKVIALQNSDIGQRLSALCDKIAERFSGRVEVRRGDTTTGVTIQPLSASACAARWSYDDGRISAGIGEGDWVLLASIEGIVQLEQLIEAAVSGEVEELVLPGIVATVASRSGVEFARAEVPYSPPAGGAGFGWVAGSRERDRYRRGDVKYEPW